MNVSFHSFVPHSVFVFLGTCLATASVKTFAVAFLAGLALIDEVTGTNVRALFCFAAKLTSTYRAANAWLVLETFFQTFVTDKHDLLPFPLLLA